MSAFSTDLHALHARIVAGELTKKQAAELQGVPYAHFCMRLKRAGLIDSVRTSARRAQYDSPQMEAALQEALGQPERFGLATEIARKHGIPPEQHAAFSMRVLRIRRSRAKADLCHDQRHPEPAQTG